MQPLLAKNYLTFSESIILGRVKKIVRQFRFSTDTVRG